MKWKELFTPTNLVLVVWMAVQGASYASSWVWAADNTAKLQADKISQLEQTVKAQNESLYVFHTFTEVVGVRLTNMEQTLHELKDAVKELR